MAEKRSRMVKKAVNAAGGIRGARALIIMAVIIDPRVQEWIRELAAALHITLPENILAPLLGLAGAGFWVARKLTGSELEKPNLTKPWS